MFYSLRKKANYALFAHRARKIHDTPPIACNPSASCQVHTMLCQDDLILYLVGIKSLLRYSPNVGVLVYSDGTLEGPSAALLSEHVPGIRIISTGEADQRAGRVLGSDSFLYRLRGHDASWRRLMDTELWSSAPKRIIMDSDILVLNRPDVLIDWIENGERAFLLGQPPAKPQGNLSIVRANARPFIQDVFKARVDDLSRELGLPNSFLDGSTSGFYGCSNELSLDRVESAIRSSLSLGVPMKEWGGEQCLVIYLLSVAGATRLESTRCINFDPSCLDKLDKAQVLHFYGTYRFYRGLYPRLAARVAADMMRVSRGEAAPVALSSAR
jgi:hypothetical protein